MRQRVGAFGAPRVDGATRCSPLASIQIGVARGLILTVLRDRGLRIQSERDADVSVYDMHGRQGMSQRVALGTTEQCFDGLGAGVYVVRAIAGGSVRPSASSCAEPHTGVFVRRTPVSPREQKTLKTAHRARLDDSETRNRDPAERRTRPTVTSHPFSFPMRKPLLIAALAATPAVASAQTTLPASPHL